MLGNINGNYGPVVESFEIVAADKASEKIHGYGLCLSISAVIRVSRST